MKVYSSLITLLLPFNYAPAQRSSARLTRLSRNIAIRLSEYYCTANLLIIFFVPLLLQKLFNHLPTAMHRHKRARDMRAAILPSQTHRVLTAIHDRWYSKFNRPPLPPFSKTKTSVRLSSRTARCTNVAHLGTLPFHSGVVAGRNTI
jgi:hypothetical protein